MLKLYKRGGIWHVRGTVAGRRLRASTRTGDRARAEQVAHSLETRAFNEQQFGRHSQDTFADAALLYQQAGKRRRYLAPLIRGLGRQRLSQIKPGDLKMLAMKLYPTQTNSTRNTCVLKPAMAVINHAAELGLCAPIRCKKFPEAKVLRHAVDRDWLDRFRAVASDRLGTLALFMFTTGARLGEAIKLAPEHLDLAGKRAVLPTSKNGDPRVFYLTDELVQSIGALPVMRTHYGRGARRVFGWSDKSAVDVPWRKACADAGIAYRSRHEAGRHSFATEMIVRRGVDPATVAKLGNWRDIRPMLERYAHAENLSDVVEKAMGGHIPTQTGFAHGRKIRRIK